MSEDDHPHVLALDECQKYVLDLSYQVLIFV